MIFEKNKLRIKENFFNLVKFANKKFKLTSFTW